MSAKLAARLAALQGEGAILPEDTPRLSKLLGGFAEQDADKALAELEQLKAEGVLKGLVDLTRDVKFPTEAAEDRLATVMFTPAGSAEGPTVGLPPMMAVVSSKKRHTVKKVISLPTYDSEPVSPKPTTWTDIFASKEFIGTLRTVAPAVATALYDVADSGLIAYQLDPMVTKTSGTTYVYAVIGPYWVLRAALGDIDPQRVLAGSHGDIADPIKPAADILRPEMSDMAIDAPTDLAGPWTVPPELPPEVSGFARPLDGRDLELGPLSLQSNARSDALANLARTVGLLEPLAFAARVEAADGPELDRISRQLDWVGSLRDEANIPLYQAYKDLVDRRRFGKMPSLRGSRARPVNAAVMKAFNKRKAVVRPTNAARPFNP